MTFASSLPKYPGVRGSAPAVPAPMRPGPLETDR